MGKVKVACAVLVVLVVSSPSFGSTFVYHFFMDGSQEAPTPVVTPGTGECSVTLVENPGAPADNNTVTVSCTYSGLSSNANAAHIHVGAVGVAGGPVLSLSFTAATSGTATATNAPFSDANATAMKAGNTYVNVHTVNNSGGEIRGQVVGQIPAMTTWGLLATAILVVTAGTLVMRRKLARAAA